MPTILVTFCKIYIILLSELKERETRKKKWEWNPAKKWAVNSFFICLNSSSSFFLGALLIHSPIIYPFINVKLWVSTLNLQVLCGYLIHPVSFEAQKKKLNFHYMLFDKIKQVFYFSHFRVSSEDLLLFCTHWLSFFCHLLLNYLFKQA